MFSDIDIIMKVFCEKFIYPMSTNKKKATITQDTLESL